MMIDPLRDFDTITLGEMQSVRLMNRIDTKYVATMSQLRSLLAMAGKDYRVQCIDGEVIAPYHTLYFDTDDFDMYMAHLHGKKRRQKVRIREYVASGLSFLEVKRKNNKGRTDKKRIECADFGSDASAKFIDGNCVYNYADLRGRIENNFSRITLVNRNKTERVTIDLALRFHNLRTDNVYSIPEVAVIELKRDGNQPSQLTEMLRQLRVKPASFSKYCMGLALTDPHLKNNRFKPQLRRLQKLQQRGS